MTIALLTSGLLYLIVAMFAEAAFGWHWAYAVLKGLALMCFLLATARELTIKPCNR